MKKYDIFISYRRDNYHSANLIATRLKAEGYRVFFDLESMRSGKFNEQLYQVIEQCKDFVLVLPPDSLDRCHNEDDWVRLEILEAIRTGKNIIPVLLTGFKWPETMPKGLEELPLYQGVSASDEFFDLAFKRLVGYLKSHRNTLLRRTTRTAAIICTAIAAVYLVMELVFTALAVPVCQNLARHMTSQMSYLNLLMDSNLQMQNCLAVYDESKKENALTLLDFCSSELEKMRVLVDQIKMETTEFENFLLGGYKMDGPTLQQYNQYILSYFDNQRDEIEIMRKFLSLEDPYPSQKEYVINSLKLSESTIKMAYFSYLQVINSLPSKSQEPYHKMFKNFTKLPPTGIGLKDSEYESLIERCVYESDLLMNKLKASNLDIADKVEDMLAIQDSIYNSDLQKYKQTVEELFINPADGPDLNWKRIELIAQLLQAAIQTKSEELPGDTPHPITVELVLSDLNRMLDQYKALYTEDGMKVEEFREKVGR